MIIGNEWECDLVKAISGWERIASQARTGEIALQDSIAADFKSFLLIPLNFANLAPFPAKFQRLFVCWISGRAQ